MKKTPLLAYSEWPRLEIRPMIIYLGEPPAAHRHITTTNGFYSLWFVETGSVRIESKHGTLQVRKSEWILAPPFLSKRQDFAEGTRILSLGFEATWASELPWMQFEHPVQGRILSGNALIILARQLLTAFTAQDRMGYQPMAERKIDAEGMARLQGGFFQLLALLTPLLLKQGATIPSSHAKDSRVDRIITELQARPSIHTLPYARWKNEVGLSRVQIDRLFRSEFGNTPRHQRDRFLLAAIKRHLLTRRAGTKETAGLFGFSDSSHLCRWFRQHTSVSPEHFRIHGSG